MELGVDLESTRDANRGRKAEEAFQEQGGDVTLLLKLPDGSEHKHSFKVGVTVAYVKMIVEREHNIPLMQQVLKSNGRALLDPLSLSDCPGMDVGAVVDVEVSTK